MVDAWKGYVWHCGPNHRHRKVNLLDFFDVMCKDMLNNALNDGNRKTCDSTYSICPPPSKKRGPSATNVVEQRPTTAAGHTDGELLNDLSLDGSSSVAILNKSQISDMTMDPLEFLPSPPITRNLNRTKTKCNPRKYPNVDIEVRGPKIGNSKEALVQKQKTNTDAFFLPEVKTFLYKEDQLLSAF